MSERRNVGDDENRPYMAGGGYPAEPDEAAPDGWYPAAMREHDRANAAELDRNAAQQRAASWWEAAKTYARGLRAANVRWEDACDGRDAEAARANTHLRRADAAEAKLDQIREVIAEDAETRARFQVDVSTSYGPRFLNRIRTIVGEVQP